MSATILAALRARAKRQQAARDLAERVVIEQLLCTQEEWNAAWGQMLRGVVYSELRTDGER